MSTQKQELENKVQERTKRCAKAAKEFMEELEVSNGTLLNELYEGFETFEGLCSAIEEMEMSRIALKNLNE